MCTHGLNNNPQNSFNYPNLIRRVLLLQYFILMTLSFSVSLWVIPTFYYRTRYGLGYRTPLLRYAAIRIRNLFTC